MRGEAPAGPHRLVNPPSLVSPIGFAHAVVAAHGRTVYLGGQTGHLADGSLAGPWLLEQFEQAAANVATALEAAGARPEHLVSMQVLVTDAAEYRASLEEVGRAYRRHLGRHYPAMAFYEVGALFDDDARVELVGVAVVPEEEDGPS